MIFLEVLFEDMEEALKCFKVIEGTLNIMKVHNGFNEATIWLLIPELPPVVVHNIIKIL